MAKNPKRILAVICGAVVAVGVPAGIVHWWSVADMSAYEAEMESYERRDGAKEAQTDIERGVFKWKILGLQRGFDIRAKIVREKLGVELDWFKGCETTEGAHAYEKAYNATMWTYLVSRFGASLVLGVLGDPREELHKE